ncbi:hypothetical protein MBLNU457_g0250t1 [Dothideomycetes sp. NU457]
MVSSEELLEGAARDGSFDISEWPRVLETVLEKLRDIVYNDFPLPALPPPVPILPSQVDPEVIAASPASRPSPSQPVSQPQSDRASDAVEPSSQSSSTTNKENNAPSNHVLVRPDVPPFPTSSNGSASSLPNSSTTRNRLPPELLSSYNSSTRILQQSFKQSPPYTIQRLAELVMYPRRHYRHLPPYLAALDRVVSVSSPLSDFPLPQLTVNTTTNGSYLSNGDSTITADREGLASDESLGGALLTPIPWLRKENSLADAVSNAQSLENGYRAEHTEDVNAIAQTLNGSSEDHTPTDEEKANMTTEEVLRAEGAVTQGELLRQEQEAGVVPVAQATTRRSMLSGTPSVARDPIIPSREGEEKPEEHPHARGPDLIGMEDMGPQEGGLGVSRPLDMEAAVGRRSKSPQPPEKEAEKEEAKLEDLSAEDTKPQVLEENDVEIDEAKAEEIKADEPKVSEPEPAVKEADKAEEEQQDVEMTG